MSVYIRLPSILTCKILITQSTPCRHYCYTANDEEGTTSGGKDYGVSYESNDQLRHKVMEPDEGKPPELVPIKEYSADEERNDTRRYRVVTVGDVSVQIDMQAVEPYKKIIQHMGESYDP